MCKVPSVQLASVVTDRRYDGINIRRKVCAAIQRSDATLSRVISDDAVLDHNQAAQLSRTLDDDLDDQRVARCFVGDKSLIVPKRFGTADGCHDDDACDFHDAGARWRRAMKEGRTEDAGRILAHIRTEVLPNMQAETDAQR